MSLAIRSGWCLARRVCCAFYCANLFFVDAPALAQIVTKRGATIDQRGPVKSLLEIRSEGLVLQNWDMSCGAAALLTVLKYRFGVNLTERFVADAMLRSGDREAIRRQGGFSFLDMKRFAGSIGFQARGIGLSTPADIASHPHAIVPVLEIGRLPHFIVVRSAAQNGDLDVADPAFGNRAIPLERFRAIWEPKVALVIEKKQPASEMK